MFMFTFVVCLKCAASKPDLAFVAFFCNWARLISWPFVDDYLAFGQCTVLVETRTAASNGGMSCLKGMHHLVSYTRTAHQGLQGFGLHFDL